MKLSDFIVKEIYRITSTDKIFGYIGGMVAHLVDSIYLNKDVEMVNMITEQGAGFSAEGYSRSTGKLGVAIATSGPGATNLVTPIANAFFDSTPMLFITGQVNTYEYKKYDLKQCAFQETDIVSIVNPIVKYAKLVTKAEDIKYELQKAIHIAMSGRKGPVLLDIPMDIQRAEIDENLLKSFDYIDTKTTIDFDCSLIEKSKRPLILVGNGVNLSNATETLRKFLNSTKIPVVQSLLGVDSVLNDYEYNMGFIGTYGNRYGNISLYNSDLLIVLGSRLDIRQTGSKLDFLKNKKIVHVDIDEQELNCPALDKICVKSDIKDFLEYLNTKELSINISEWQEYCLKIRKMFPNYEKNYNTPNLVLDSIFEKLKEGDVIISDVGQNQVWTAQSAKIKKEQRLFSSGGHGCMGYALPASIGSAVSGRRAIVITGDGGFQMNIQELEVLKRRKLPVKVIVLNNKNLGMVRTFQELYFDGRCASTVEDYSAPDFEAIAKAYGIGSVSIDSKNFDVEEILSYLNSSSPVVININFEVVTQVEPRLQFGNSIEKASPELEEEFLKELLIKEV